MKEEASKNPIQVAEKIFLVIETLAENGPMGIMELSSSLGYHKSTTHRLVNSLVCLGYIRQDEESLKYSLSLKFLEIGGKILEQTNMAALIHPSLKKLSEQTGRRFISSRERGRRPSTSTRWNPAPAPSAWYRAWGAGFPFTAPVSARRFWRSFQTRKSAPYGRPPGSAV